MQTSEDDVKSPPNSPFPPEEQDNDYNLQVDYWVSSFGGQNQQQQQNLQIMNQTNSQQQPQTSKDSQQLSSSSGSTKITKSTTKGLFKYLNVSKINSPTQIQQFGQDAPMTNNLSLNYVIKEKKQKSKFFSFFIIFENHSSSPSSNAFEG